MACCDDYVRKCVDADPTASGYADPKPTTDDIRLGGCAIEALGNARASGCAATVGDFETRSNDELDFQDGLLHLGSCNALFGVLDQFPSATPACQRLHDECNATGFFPPVN